MNVRARLAAASADAPDLSGRSTVELGGPPQPMLFRRGPATGNRLVPAATFLFSRTERARLEFPIAADTKISGGRLLDRMGHPLGVPVTMSDRVDAATGQRWATADITLAALAAGDYAVEVTIARGTTTDRRVAAIRVGR